MSALSIFDTGITEENDQINHRSIIDPGDSFSNRWCYNVSEPDQLPVCFRKVTKKGKLIFGGSVMYRKTAVLVILMIILAMTVHADGGGGMFFGYQISEYPLLQELAVRNNSLGLAYFGGHGYGIDSDGVVVGGFGFAILDADSETEIAGGFGGIIAGIRLISVPINLSLISWTGFGGIGVNDDRGYFALSEEVTLEIGLPILSWFMPTFYVGYQVAGNLIPGALFNQNEFLSYTPVAGLRIQWGDFR